MALCRLGGGLFLLSSLLTNFELMWGYSQLEHGKNEDHNEYNEYKDGEVVYTMSHSR